MARHVFSIRGRRNRMKSQPRKIQKAKRLAMEHFTRLDMSTTIAALEQVLDSSGPTGINHDTAWTVSRKILSKLVACDRCGAAVLRTTAVEAKCCGLIRCAATCHEDHFSDASAVIACLAERPETHRTMPRPVPSSPSTLKTQMAGRAVRR